MILKPPRGPADGSSRRGATAPHRTGTGPTPAGSQASREALVGLLRAARARGERSANKVNLE